jgi:hypothetical protein
MVDMQKGHSHEYARTKLMSSYEWQEYENNTQGLKVLPGKSFSVVSGAGATSNSRQKSKIRLEPWWEATLAVL